MVTKIKHDYKLLVKYINTECILHIGQLAE